MKIKSCYIFWKLLNVENPDTFNDETNVVLLNVLKPDTFNDETNVVLFNDA